ncbi:MAG: ABC transporter ATP-binding protein [Clostridia bacterium]|nr:ABC transporter ATP-binding protein [Clostridia bacterium]
MGNTGADIHVEDVSVIFNGNKGEKTQALSHVSLDINKGEFISLLGPSGCGKTTLLRTIADLQDPTEGSVMIGDMTPAEMRKNRQYGMVFQSPVLYDWRSVLSNVMLPLEIMHVPRPKRFEKAEKMLEMVGLSDYLNHYPFQLSGGMQQRVGIARALVMNPKILLMDEPFSALDEFTREKLNEDLLKVWRKTNKTVVFVTHNIAESVFLSDRVVVLSPHPGRVSAIVDIDLPRPRTRELRDTAEFNEYVVRIRNSFEGVD